MSHGWTDILLPYAVTAAGVLTGMKAGGAKFARMLRFPFFAVPAFIIALILWGILSFLLKPGLASMVRDVLATAFALMVGFVTGLVVATPVTVTNHTRGTILDRAPDRPVRRSNGRRPALTLAGLPVDAADETKHFKLIGTTGTGKSTAIRELLAGALARGDRAVIADPDGSYLNRYYNPNRGDVILNPFDPRSARWDLFGEMTTLFDADQLSQSLIADTEGAERSWRNYARVFLTSLLRQLHRVKHHDVAELYQLLTTTAVDDLRDLLGDTPAGAYLGQDNGKFFGAVRAVANTYLAGLEHISLQTAADTLSVRSWIRKGSALGAGGGGGVLFLPYRANEIATLRGLISTWMRLAIVEALSQAEGDQRLWFVVDELDAVGPIDGLKDALARLRKFGGRCILGFQSIAQVSGTYGQAEAQTIVENCGNTLILRCSASEGGGTSRFASRLIGEREVMREQVTHGRSGGPIFASDHRSVSTSLHPVMESAVLPSEIEQLPDLHGYLKFASLPAWTKIELRH